MKHITVFKPRSSPQAESDLTFLGIEGGGTHSLAILADPHGQCLQRVETNGPANMRLMTEAQLGKLFQHIARQMDRPTAVGIGMAGVLEETEKNLLRAAAAQAWPSLPC